ncbi:MAG: hypothetical protein CFH34_01541 [Alphaproteobacteria bacterium MarineAlpha9_Bin4]|nr:MAG: hypothetical protein CFH34_01541 [Alphaproteobacteria bacterium MarineAlpha9_Bin4]
MKIVTIYFLNIVFFNLSFSLDSNDACEDYNTKLREARSFFKSYKEIDLNLTLRSSFIKNYNHFSHEKKKLDVDRLTLFMLLDKTEWYILGAKNKCFTFWINLEPDRFVELIDGGSLSLGQGNWLED